MKLEMKVPRTIWLPRSRMKLPTRRGPNCDDALVTATSVMEKVTPATPSMDDAMVASTARALSTSVSSKSLSLAIHSAPQIASTQRVRKEKAVAAENIRLGRNQ